MQNVILLLIQKMPFLLWYAETNFLIDHTKNGVTIFCTEPVKGIIIAQHTAFPVFCSLISKDIFLTAIPAFLAVVGIYDLFADMLGVFVQLLKCGAICNPHLDIKFPVTIAFCIDNQCFLAFLDVTVNPQALIIGVDLMGQIVFFRKLQ